MKPESTCRVHCPLFTGLIFFKATDSLVRLSTVKIKRMGLVGTDVTALRITDDTAGYSQKINDLCQPKCIKAKPTHKLTSFHRSKIKFRGV